MTTEQIEQSRRIAVYDGWEVRKISMNDGNVVIKDEWFAMMPNTYPFHKEYNTGETEMSIKHLAYHKFFDWQQPVWKKVNEEAKEFYEEQKYNETPTDHWHRKTSWGRIVEKYRNAYDTGTPEQAFPYLVQAVDWVQEQKK